MPELPHGTVTFLFTDIESSTRLWQEHPDAMTDAYARHDAILREAITGQGGVVYKTVGDAFQVAFPTAPQAVIATLIAQQALQHEAWPLLEPLQVRMALHTGAVDPDPDGDYRSPVLNRLGRLLGAGHGGQVLLSTVTAELVRDHLPAKASIKDLGDQRLKDLYRPERVYQLGGRGLAADFPPLRTLDARPNNLKTQPTMLIGREQETATLRALLAREEVRLVTLTGPGGTGKTRLGLQVAADLLDHFEDGVCVVELAALSDPDLVPGTIATTLGVQETGDRSLTTLLADHLGDKRLLLMLDNFEQVTDAAPLVGELLASCPRLKVLVTSRIRLGLRGERDYPVPPLGVPDPRRLLSVAVLSQYEAVRLFLERAQEVTPSFAITNANAPAVAEICARLDGLPLAIELAAARIRMLPPEAMLKRLTARLPLLTGGARDLPLRQQTLRGAIAWSYELLAPDEQALFRRLSVFAGGCTLEAIEAVAAGDELELDIFYGLERLVDHNLVRQTATEGEPRFAMLETIREYGLDQLEAQGESEEARQRHASYFVALGEQVGPETPQSEWEPWLDRMETEHDNLRAVCGWTLEHDLAMAYQLVSPMGRLWTQRGYAREGVGWFERVLASCGPDVPTADRANVLRWLSYAAMQILDLVRARAWGEEAIAIYRTLDDRRRFLSALNTLMGVASMQGERDLSVALSREVIELVRELDDPFLTCDTLNSAGFTAYMNGDLDQARTWLEEALGLARKNGDNTSLANVLHSFGEVYRASGDITRAEAFYREAVVLGSKASFPIVFAECFQGLGSTAAVTKQATRAARLFGAEATLRDALDWPREPASNDERDRLIDLIREALGEEAFDATYAAGGALALEDAVAEALADG